MSSYYISTQEYYSILFSSLSLTSCKDADDNKSEMKNPTESIAVFKKTIAMGSFSVAEAKVKTIANLEEAYNGESNATARYAAFSKKAAEEGYKEIALLFKAASLAEEVHADNH